jgi:chromatin segregation and condensation protein Rec8/ScpA/Scc1 (kleisin family)
MNIEMQQQDKQLEWYNASMASLNEVAAILNKFIEYRNNQFIPEKPDSELSTLLDGIDSKIVSSQKNLDEVDKSEAKLVLGTEPVRERIQSLLKKIQEQKEFLKRYLNTPAAERESLFY